MHPLFAFELFEITPVGLFALVGWAVAGVCAGKLLYKDDRHLKELQREANELADELAKHGFHLLPPILRDLAFLDLVQLRNDFRHAVNTLKDPVKRRAELAQLLEGLVKAELADAKTRQAFLDGVISQASLVGLKPSPAAAATPVAAPPAEPVKA
ncbi:MAG TPA: hypothetical protein VMV10_09250 [Pirellulales bacterium]|nr:hypothetical protein [Pirellulales bacterium]